MTAIDYKLKAQGHLKIGNSLEKRARRAGKNSDLFAQYLHHCERYCHYMNLAKTA